MFISSLIELKFPSVLDLSAGGEKASGFSLDMVIYCFALLSKYFIKSMIILCKKSTRDEHGTGPVSISYRISGIDFFLNIN